MTVAIIGTGAVGRAAGSQMASHADVGDVVVFDRTRKQALAAVGACGGDVVVADSFEAAISGADVAIATGSTDHAGEVRAMLEHGCAVVSTVTSRDVVRQLLDLAPLATEAQVPLVIGAAFSPGLSCLLAAHAAATFDEVDEIHVYRAGSGGGECQAEFRRSLRAGPRDWNHGWVDHRVGSGRELSWFPPPVGAVDCYRVAGAEPELLVDTFAGVGRVTVRSGAASAERLGLPRPLHRVARGGVQVGAIRIEVRGRRGAEATQQVLGVIDKPDSAAGVVAAAAALAVIQGHTTDDWAGSAAKVLQHRSVISDLASRGVRAAIFDGSAVI